MPANSSASLWRFIGAQNYFRPCFLWAEEASQALSDLATESALGGHGDELAGKSVVIATTSQLAAALALIELDGVARRIVLFPPDLSLEHLPYVMECAEADSIVSDGRVPESAIPPIRHFLRSTGEMHAGKSQRHAQYETQWILLTSGTTGRPKLVVHTLSSLAGAIDLSASPVQQIVWSTFYDIRRYGGLQIFLRAVLTGTSIVLSSARESTADFLKRAGSRGVTHISGTPSHWRRAVMSSESHQINPDYVRLSGEIADQSILNNLRAIYPEAHIAHAFATTEAGVAFDVNDGLEGFPQSVFGNRNGIEMKVEDRSLRIRSDRTASGYLGCQTTFPKDARGFVDTGDLVEIRAGRCFFVGRRDGVINIGGQKVYPEEVEAVINRHPAVHMSLVQRRKNPITGALVVAKVVLRADPESGTTESSNLQREILSFCREMLSPHKVPATIHFVPALPVSESGKLIRNHA